jgi:apolipoprotein N-acyltransferase
LPQKFAIVVLLVVALLAIGVFAPAFARQIMDGALLTAILIVAAAWLAWHVARAWSQMAAAWAQRRAARVTTPPSPPATPPPPPAAASAATSPFAAQEGGPSHE